MDRLVARLLVLSFLTTPAFATSHCPSPETPLPPFDVIRSLKEGKSYTQAHDLTYREALVARNNRVADMCEADPENFNYNCDAEPYPTFEDINPEFLNLPETEYSKLREESRIAGAAAGQRVADCLLKGTDNADG